MAAAKRRTGIFHSLERVLGFVLGSGLLLAGFVVVKAPWVTPWTADQLDHLDITYTVRPDGSVQVREELTLRFGPRSGRHGPTRDIRVREPLDRSRDIAWPISEVNAHSPSGHPADVQRTTATSTDGRTEVEWIRLGTEDQTVRDATASYVLEYEQEGLVRPSTDGDVEFSINAGGPRMWASNVTTRIITPEPPKESGCWLRFGNCAEARVEGTAAIARVDRLRAGQELTVAARLEAGTVETNQRTFPTEALLVQRYLGTWWMWLVAAAIFGALGWLVGFLGAPRSPGDDRYRGLAPGTLPDGQDAAVGPDDHPEIPVAFTPPTLSLAEAGFLLDGRPLPRHLAATLVGLACDKAIELLPGHNGQPASMRALRQTHLNDGPSTKAFKAAFAGTDHVAVDDDRMVMAFASMADHVEEQATRQGWVHPSQGRWTGYREAAQKRLEDAPATDTGEAPAVKDDAAAETSDASGQRSPWGHVLVWAIVGFVATLIIVVAGQMVPALAFAPLLMPFLTVPKGQNFAVRRQPRRRTAKGRALTDQVEGFRTYLRTAEASQLRFQEGEDIYTGYLPWAVLFGCAERWVRVCQQAIGDELLPAPQVDLAGADQVIAWVASGTDIDRGFTLSFTDLDVDRNWAPPTPTSGPASWFSGDGGSSSGSSSSWSSGGGAGSGGSGGSYGSW